MVTAEIALGLTALGMVLAVGLWTVALVADQMRCQDAARDVARAIARGEPEQVARQEGRRAAPDGARIRIAGADGWAEVEVSLNAVPPWPVLEPLGDLEVRAEAAVAYEPGEQLGSAARQRVDADFAISAAALGPAFLVRPPIPGLPARPRSRPEQDVGPADVVGRVAGPSPVTVRHRPSEGGSGTVLVLATGGILFTVLGAVTMLAGALTAQHRVDVASELAALSAAGTVDQRDPCRVAARVAREHQVRLDGCVLVEGGARAADGEVSASEVVAPAVKVTVRGWIEPVAGFRAELTASSVAGR